VPGEFLRANREVSYEADDERFMRREIEHPLIIL
jgi:hypothetical protein